MATATEELKYFRVKLGGHIELDENGKEVFYGPGDVFASKVDRVKQHGANKFEKLDDPPSTLKNQQVAKAAEAGYLENRKLTTNELNDMTRADLVKLAQELDIELSPGAKKEEIINVISDYIDTA